MHYSHSVPARSLPDQPSIVQLREQAKELLKAYQTGEPAAVGEVERFEQNLDRESFALADAQHVLARAYGFSSWAKLEQHVEGWNVNVFCAAADSGDTDTVRRLAAACPELVNSERGGEFGEKIAMHFAVLRRDAEMTRILMELGSDARKGVWPHRDATSAFTIAREREYHEITAIIEQAEQRRRRDLSADGATISSKTDEILKAILHDRSEEAMGLLQSDLSQIGACDQRGTTPLHVAAWVHNPAMVAWLLERQAPVDARDVDGKTPLDNAAIVAGSSGHGRDFCFMENSRKSLALFEETVRLLRSNGAELTPRAAVAIGDALSVRKMHDAGQLTNNIHRYRGGLLAIAVRVNRIDMVSLLLDLGLDPDETAPAEEGDDTRSWGFPLWFAAMCGRHEIARVLLARGADVNAIVFACGDALSIAEATGDPALKQLLLQHGARITVEHVAGEGDRQTARGILEGTIPAQSLNVAEPSLTDLAEQMLWAAGSSDPKIVRMCLPYVTRKPNDPWWNYVLMHATLPESFLHVLQHGVDPNVVATGGYTMLHHLASIEVHLMPGRRQITEEGRLALATMLLDAGASLTLRDAMLHSTPLGWACRWGRADLVRLYLARGTDAVEPDAESWATPLAWARKGRHLDIIQLLDVALKPAP